MTKTKAAIQEKPVARANMPVNVFDYPPVSLQHYSFDKLPHRVPYLPLTVWKEDFPGGHDSGMHQHDDFCMIFLVYGGQGLHVVNGHTYNVLSGDVYVLPPGTVHRFLKYQGLRLYCLSFPLELLSRSETASLRKTGLWKLMQPVDSRHRRGAGPHRLHLPPEQNSQAEAMIAEIFEEAHRPPPGPLLARYGFFRLLATLSRWHDRPSSPRQATGSAEKPGRAEAESGRTGETGIFTGMQEIVSYCETHFDEELGAAQLAARMFLSQSQFDRLFRRAFGMPPGAYLRQLRLAHAHRLLSTTALPIADIAAACGMGDAIRLARAFRSVFGITPSGFRRSLRGK